MLKIILNQSSLISLFADTLMLTLQVFVVLLRKQDWRRLKFLLLIGGFWLFNLLITLSNGWWGDQYSQVLIIISSGSAFLLAAYYLYYIVSEFKLPRVINNQQKYFLLSLGCAYGCGVLTVYFQSGQLRQAETPLLLLPLVATFIYCMRLEIRVRRTDAKQREASQYLMIYSGYLAIILITSTPVIGRLKDMLGITFVIINLLFLITAVTYFYRFILSHHATHEKTPEIILHHREVSLSEYDLTPREMEIALLLLQNLSNHEISKKLITSESNIRSQATAIYKKTNTRKIEGFRKKFA